MESSVRLPHANRTKGLSSKGLKPLVVYQNLARVHDRSQFAVTQQRILAAYSLSAMAWAISQVLLLPPIS